MPFVVDASIAATWLMPDEAHPVAEAALDRLETEAAIVPAIWWFEIRNLLIQNERRGRLDRQISDKALAMLARLPITLDREPDERSVLDLARRHKLTIYDAAYLELALRMAIPIASLDRELLDAAGREGASLLAT